MMMNANLEWGNFINSHYNDLNYVFVWIIWTESMLSLDIIRKITNIYTIIMNKYNIRLRQTLV